VHKEHNWFDKRLTWKCGNGSRIRFWEDWWVGEELLMRKFPRLYSVAVYKEKVVSDFGMWTRDESTENFTGQILWRRELFEWEKEMKKHLMELVFTFIGIDTSLMSEVRLGRMFRLIQFS